ncbi:MULTISPECIES: hypothetical protein [Dolichospermum]|uniref:Uncharacterized protein n=1 Tax=Dolichospermum heterosporum TAC447 TaxID=747523 RepID=A0ABY5LWZ2_9CYAN|nr:MULTISPECIES: hypothetical protein [Dolichospermum]MDK2461192.1 hypothetical protein [Aphanizomenon sp. PH219]UUO16533.1 hypothetical protein NG743_05725 [Dolichospermum heterosporum TAC447]
MTIEGITGNYTVNSEDVKKEILQLQENIFQIFHKYCRVSNLPMVRLSEKLSNLRQYGKNRGCDRPFPAVFRN